MSGLILPALAIGGVYILYSGLTKKNKSKHDSSSSSPSSSSYSSSSSSSSSSSTPSSSLSSRVKTKKHRKQHKSVSSNKGIHVKKNHSRKYKSEKSIREVTAYYTYGGLKGKTWTYNNLPSGWSLKKKDDTKSSSKYTKMVVFSGPKDQRDAMKKYLNHAFEYLKKKHIVKHFKITSEMIPL
jgi:hypothetical protein